MRRSTPAPGERFVCSWSGGKDSCLALHRSVRAGAVPALLLTLLTEAGQRSRSHGLARSVLEAQSEALGIPLLTAATSWRRYEASLVALLGEARRQGATAAVFGDLDIAAHGHFEQRVARRAGLVAHLPLWGEPRRVVLEEGWRFGFEARVVAVRKGTLDRAHLGRVLDRDLVEACVARGVDPCGEYGEFHTLATEGPLFRRALHVTPGRAVERDGYWFLDFITGSDPRSGTSGSEA